MVAGAGGRWLRGAVVDGRRPAAGCVAFCATEAATDDGEMVMVRPSLLKLAITGIEEFTVTTAVPLLSL